MQEPPPRLTYISILPKQHIPSLSICSSKHTYALSHGCSSKHPLTRQLAEKHHRIQLSFQRNQKCPLQSCTGEGGTSTDTVLSFSDYRCNMAATLSS
ncbi:rCG52315 [Rattus norvegicus]|uniref:RCG52315 n=1 Tax=Rattus norvegicus TaxID=10116 RepID=A6K0T6_RAT|nr:rCG52315 [Rattus norvegicus]